MHNRSCWFTGARGPIPDAVIQSHLRGVRAAAEAGYRILSAGGTSLDAVEAAVVIMEDDETFDAGRGSFLNVDGRVQLPMPALWTARRFAPAA